MKKIIYTVLCLMLVSLADVIAQNDILLQEDFSSPFDAMQFDNGVNDGVSNSVFGSGSLWVNYDADGIAAGGNAPSKSWYWDSLDFTGEKLGVIKSQSWLQGFSPDNRNWLILPLIKIVDVNAVLSWKSAPYQGPSYMDGYTVLVSNRGRNVRDSTQLFTDTLFHAAEMDSSLVTSATLNLSDYAFSSGYIHANGYTDSMYFKHPGEDTTFDATNDFNLGQLESHSVSLSAYSGQWIYIAFLHDSQDDNTLELDDILVMGTTPVVNTNKINEEIGLSVFPNPAHEFVTVNYEVIESTDISMQVYDMQGRLMQVYNNVSNTAGEHQQKINVRNLPIGNYNIVITTDNQRLSKQFVKY